MTYCFTLEKVGYPVLVRPSYVLSGAAMNVAGNSADLIDYLDQVYSLIFKFTGTFLLLICYIFRQLNFLQIFLLLFPNLYWALKKLSLMRLQIKVYS